MSTENNPTPNRRKLSLISRVEPSLQVRTARFFKTYGPLMAAVAGILSITMEDHNKGIIKLGANHGKFIGANFINHPGAEFINNGEVHYQGIIVNNGKMDCGDCQSGVVALNNKQNETQTIQGENIIKWYDLIIDNEGGVNLENEVQLVNSFYFKSGIIITDRNQPEHFVHFHRNSIASEADASRHVDGYVGKSGGRTFVFPTGDGSSLNPIGIDAADSISFAKAAYFAEDPSQATSYTNGPFSLDLKDESLEQVYEFAFWDLQCKDKVQTTLFWKEGSFLPTFVDDLSALTVAAWNGEKWVNIGQSATEGNLEQGSVTSLPIIPERFQAFTFAKLLSPENEMAWIKVDAKLIGGNGELNWETQYEKEALLFHVEKSSDAMNFQAMEEVQAIGTSENIERYAFVDDQITQSDQPQKLFYRLKLESIDGAYQYSPIVELKVAPEEPDIQMVVYPNPTRDYAKIRYSGASQTQGKVTVLTIDGNTVFEGMASAHQDLLINVQDWNPGTYIVAINDGKVKKAKQLVVN